MEEKTGYTINCISFLRVFSIILCVCEIVTCILAYIGMPIGNIVLAATDMNINADWSINVLLAYLILLSILIILAELTLTFVLQWFFFLYSPIGRGLAYIIIGLLTLGVAGIIGFIVGLLWLVNAFLHLIVGLIGLREIVSSSSTTTVVKRETVKTEST